MPGIAQTTLAPFECPSIVRTELLTSMSNGLIRDDDASLGQQVFDIAKAQTETVIKPDSVADDFGREPMAVIARTAGFHGASLAAPSSS